MRLIKIDKVPFEKRGKYKIRRLLTEVLNTKPDNIGFYQTVIPPKSLVPEHCHQKLDEILFFLTPAKIKINGKLINLNRGDIVTLKPNDWHEIYSSEKEARLIAIKLPNIIDDKIIR